ncbi:MAG TPA: hypothetical protein VGG41_13415 [Solirubrobacteraceae bacterium]|jgi:hypothetical protein
MFRRLMAVAAAAAVCLLPGSGLGASASGATLACGPATLATLTALDSSVATNIYRGELGGSETEIDLSHVGTSAALLAAVAADNQASTLTVVKQLVYHPFWHIVRLRVLDAAGKLLADVGGAYVIAPVSRPLKQNGRVIGSFVMSVQDDTGFTKLESRAVGDPIAIYIGGRRILDLGADFPLAQPTSARLTLDGTSYGLVADTYNAFPTGTLVAVIAVPAPTLVQESQSCASVSLAETERVVKRIAARFDPLAARYGNFVETVHADTGAVVVVRIGLRAIAGSEGPGPPALPQTGPVSYQGKIWSVFSFAPTPPARIFVLVPQAP